MGLVMENKDIESIISKYKKKGMDIKLRDIAYAILATYIPKEYAYAVTYSPIATIDEVNAYAKKDYVVSLCKEIQSKISKQSQQSEKKAHKTDFKEISFEENREGLMKLLEELEIRKKEGEIKVSDAIKIEADIRTKLNDKFGASDKVDTSRVIVNTKFNHICEWTRKECYLQTKEYAKRQWNLVDFDEIKEKFELIPKIKNEQER